ncbi:hypothetical protein [Lacticaseibacillus paracasei]|uniref:hypothetical protein n=1 Tax=Lacticaseibacillus paracasei TaxID=1597 RepID=UPI0015FE226B|nr:hypothetical protein [Lacticaseibacillus paracasei]
MNSTHVYLLFVHQGGSLLLIFQQFPNFALSNIYTVLGIIVLKNKGNIRLLSALYIPDIG